jgi:hypothetical protein
MKVAVCISGHLRSFKQGYDNFFKTFIEPNPEFQFDFFVSTWDSCDWRTKEKDKSVDVIIKEFTSLYNPIQIEVERNIIWNTSKYMPHVHHERWLKKGYGGVRSSGCHILGMYYKIKKCNDIKIKYENNNNFIYDLSMRHRSDFSFEGAVNLNEILKDSKETLFVPFCCEKSKNSGIPIRDVFGISSSKNINYYSSLFSNIDDVVEKYDTFRPEPMLFNHLSENKNIKIVEIKNSWKICY